MNSQYIRQIVEQLAAATGQPLTGNKNKHDFIEQTAIYTAEEIHKFIEDLSQNARLHDLTLIVNDLPYAQFVDFVTA